jgi:two-component system response regulator AdeR
MPAFSATETPEVVLDARERRLVLVVEDNDVVAGLIERLLERRGQKMLRARDGAEGLRCFSKHAPEVALVIVDCRLPDMDGLSVCRSFRCQSPDLAVLLTSGQDYAGLRWLADGPTAFLAKPFHPAEFQRQVDSLLSAIV